tara:strand:- start:80 stop:469 length:390 start_codon:yes stop_codon:yes gene_type:complete
MINYLKKNYIFNDSRTIIYIMVKYTPTRELLFKYALIMLLFLNIVDAMATLYWVENKLATETNPLMHAWIQLSPDLFITVKITLVTMGTILLWTFRKHRLAYWGGIILLLLYSLVMLVHGLIAVRTGTI